MIRSLCLSIMAPCRKFDNKGPFLFFIIVFCCLRSDIDTFLTISYMNHQL